MKSTLRNILVLACGIAPLFFGCSTKKTGWAHRTYNSGTTRFNYYFNANELVNEAEFNLYENIEDDYLGQMEVFKWGDEDDRQSVIGNMDAAIEKCTKAIGRHSMDIRNEELNTWVDNCYYVMGKAHFYKGENIQAQQMFNFVTKKYKDSDVRHMSLIWLGRTYMEQQNYDRAEQILRLAESDPTLSKESKLELHYTYAEMNIRRDSRSEAIDELERALEFERGKQRKARTNYLIAQLYRSLGDNNSAAEFYGNVVKLHPEYQMEFYARIMRALSYDGGSGNFAEVKEELEKMLRDDKNIEYRDQIYYALGTIEEREGNRDMAKEDYILATKEPLAQPENKAKSFLRLGEMSFEDRKYRPAQAYYDSCLLYLETDTENYESISKLAASLNSLVEQYIIIETQDSLQMVAAMDSVERMKFINKVIRERRAEERRLEEERIQKEFLAEQAANNPNQEGPQLPGGPNSGSWYFYNQSSITTGKSEFRKAFGTRKNEDNWRRSNKAQIDLADFNQDGDIGFGNDTLAGAQDWEDPAYYLKDLPLTDAAIRESNDMIIKAYYDLAGVYAEELNDYDEAMGAYEELNKRFSPHEFQAEVYYRMYRLAEAENDGQTASYYADLLLEQFPDSDYAKLIEDPDYFNRENEQEIAARSFYDKTYNYYDRGFYVRTIEYCDQGIAKFGNTEIAAKFALLKAMATGPEKGQQAAITALTGVVNGYPATAEAAEAQRILDHFAALEQQEAEETAEEERLESLYELDPEERHYLIVLVPIEGNDLMAIESSISNFNRSNYRMDGLKVTSVRFDDNTTMVSIKNFPNSTRGMQYYQNFVRNNVQLALINMKSLPVYLVSNTNYAIFFKDKGIDAYDTFFEETYLEE